MNKKEARVRRSRKTRVRIAEQRATRLVVSRSNCHIYAQIIAPTGDRVLAAALPPFFVSARTSASSVDAAASTRSPLGAMICA